MSFQFTLSGIQPMQFIDIDSTLTDKQFRDKYLSDRLTVKEKMAFYHSVIDNKLELFKSFLFGTPNRPPYDIFEEVSSKGYGWTVFHYAMHYGRLEIAKFIIGYLYSQNKINIAFKLKSNDGRCPLLCLLRSKALTPEVKLDVFNQLVSTFSIPISNEVRERLEIVKGRAEKDKPYNSSINPSPIPLPPQQVPNQNAYPYPDSPYISNLLTTKEKQELHDSAKDNKLEIFKTLICGSPERKPYPIFEEVSAPGYRWTCVHYAFHYGSREVIRYMLEYLTHWNLINAGFNIRTKEGKCPLLCLLKSNALKSETKREIFDSVISNFWVPVSDDVVNELKQRNFLDLVQKVRP